jgi:hypothetical protein
MGYAMHLRASIIGLTAVVLLAGCGANTSGTAPSADSTTSPTAGAATQPETDDVGDAQRAEVGKPVMLETDSGGAAELLLSSATKVPDSACGKWTLDVPHELWQLQLRIRVTRGPFPWYPSNFTIGTGSGQTSGLSAAACPASTLYPDPTVQQDWQAPPLKTGDMIDGVLMLGIRAGYDSSRVGYIQDAHHRVVWRIH